MTPTSSVTEACTYLESVTRGFWQAQEKCQLGEFEAPVECALILKLVVKHTESVIQLARTDLALLPSALVLARAALEGGINVLWVLQPEDPFEREARWLSLLANMENKATQFSRDYGEQSENDHYSQLACRTRDFRVGVSSKMPQRVGKPQALPKLWKRFNDLDRKGGYVFYKQLCQYTHGTMFATGLYRRKRCPEGGGSGQSTSEVIGESAKRSFHCAGASCQVSTARWVWIR